jgi:hypothetical protein
MAKPTRTLPPDNLPMRTHFIEEVLPHLSLKDLEALSPAIMRRYEELKAVQLYETLEAHYAHLRTQPAGTRVQYVGRPDKVFARDESVPLGKALRKPSTRIEVYDRTGKCWVLPMEWVMSEREDAATRAAIVKAREALDRTALQRQLEHHMQASGVETPR